MNHRRLLIVPVVGMALVLSACESSQDKNARLKAAAAKAQKDALKPISVGPADPRIKVVSSHIVNGTDGRVAVVVTLRNTSSKAIKDIPIGIQVFGHGTAAPIYTNTQPGFGYDLNHLSLIRPGQTFDWINDQVTGGKGSKVKVTVGKGTDIKSPPADAKLTKMHWWDDHVSGWTYKGRASTTGLIAQIRLIVYGVFRSGGQVVAAGRSAIERVAKGGKPQLVAILPVTASKSLNSTSASVTAPPVTFK